MEHADDADIDVPLEVPMAALSAAAAQAAEGLPGPSQPVVGMHKFERASMWACIDIEVLHTPDTAQYINTCSTRHSVPKVGVPSDASLVVHPDGQATAGHVAGIQGETKV